MPAIDFELSEFEQRQAKVRVAMERGGIDLLLVIHPVNIEYLIGWRGKSYQEFQVLCFPREPGPLCLLLRLPEVAEARELTLADEVYGWAYSGYPAALLGAMEAFQSIYRQHGYAGRRTCLEVPDYYLTPHHYLALKELLGDDLVLESTRLVEEVKFVKSPAELQYIWRASSIADAGMQACADALAEGKTEFEVCAEMHRAMMALGGDTPASPMNFVSGERTHYPHGMPSERRLRRGDFIHNEYGAAYRRYTVTIGRVFSLGQPTARMRELYQVVRDASDAAIATIKAGVPATAPHEAAVRVIEQAGFAMHRTHLTGYGVAPGFPPSWVESAQLEHGNPYMLQPGMVVSIEPPVHVPEEQLGARLIDNVLVTESGGEILSKFNRDLIQA